MTILATADESCWEAAGPKEVLQLQVAGRVCRRAHAGRWSSAARPHGSVGARVGGEGGGAEDCELQALLPVTVPAAHRPSVAVITREMIKTCLLITHSRLLPPVNQSATVAH